MIPIIEYMNLTKDERQSHLDLDMPCDERGGTSTNFKGLLSYMLNLEIPENAQTNKIQLAHACNNGKCSNWKHLYYATAKENIMDSGTLYERTIKKYGKDFYKVQNKKIAKQKPVGYFSKINNRKGKSLSEQHKKNLSKAIKKWHENRI